MTHIINAMIIGAICGGVAVVVINVYLLMTKREIKYGKNRWWGVNVKQNYKCVNCNSDLPRIRRPQTIRQLLYGGWSCKNCGAEIDKWENKIN